MKRTGKKLTQKRLKELLSYDPATGVFKWIKRGVGIRYGKQAGCVDSYGYRHITVDKTVYKAHRLAWMFVYGCLPKTLIDHINRNKNDNRILNLRGVTVVCNSRNSKTQTNNNSGVTGVRFHKTGKSWEAYISDNNKRQKYLGNFKSFTEAVAHRLAAEQCLGWSGCDKNTDAFKYMNKYLRGNSRA